MACRIKRHDDEYDTLEICAGSVFQLYVLDQYGRTNTIEIFFIDEDGTESTIGMSQDQRMEFLEALRDWSNDQIWKLRHEEAAA
jgi:hypothetical protein